MDALQTLPSVADRIGRYEILSDLGRGSMAQVYLALDPNIEREIALKVFLPRHEVGAAQLAEMRRRFIAKAKAAGRVQHPGLVTIFDADTDSERDLSYIAMERVEGRSLWEILAEDGPMPELPAVEIVAKVASALHAAHEEGLVHLDVKPGNILCSLDGMIKVTDFGIAQLSAATSRTDWISGSPFYMSPEQLVGEEVDARSDVYSLGAVFYECLSGAVPFTSESLAGLRYQIEEIDPRPLQTFDARIRGELACVAMKALSKDPADRFQSAHEMSQALRSALTVAPLLVSPPARFSTSPRATSPASAAEQSSVAEPILSAAPVAEVVVPERGPSPSIPPVPPAQVPQSSQPNPTPRQESRSAGWRPLAGLLLLLLSAAVILLAWGALSLRGDSGASPGVAEQAVQQKVAQQTVAQQTNAPAVIAGASTRPRVEWTRLERYEPVAVDPSRLEAYAVVEPPLAPAEREAAEEDRRDRAQRRLDEAQRLAAEAAQVRAEREFAPAADASILSTAELTSAPEPEAAPTPSGTLEVFFRNRLKGGSVSVWVDGESVATESFSGAKNVFRRTVGKDISMSIPVSSGDHEIRVRVSGANGKFDETRTTQVTISGGETRRLRLVHVPPGGLRLSWKDDVDD